VSQSDGSNDGGVPMMLG